MDIPTSATPIPQTRCYSVGIFTKEWGKVRDFYVDLLGASVVNERAGRYCEIELGGVPISIRPCECGEMVSYFHLYIAVATEKHEAILAGARTRGILVTTVGPYSNLRDPEGRVSKLSIEGSTPLT